jgi:hypothetical protein
MRKACCARWNPQICGSAKPCVFSHDQRHLAEVESVLSRLAEAGEITPPNGASYCKTGYLSKTKRISQPLGQALGSHFLRSTSKNEKMNGLYFFDSSALVNAT